MELSRLRLLALNLDESEMNDERDNVFKFEHETRTTTASFWIYPCQGGWHLETYFIDGQGSRRSFRTSECVPVDCLYDIVDEEDVLQFLREDCKKKVDRAWSRMEILLHVGEQLR